MKCDNYLCLKGSLQNVPYVIKTRIGVWEIEYSLLHLQIVWLIDWLVFCIAISRRQNYSVKFKSPKNNKRCLSNLTWFGTRIWEIWWVVKTKMTTKKLFNIIWSQMHPVPILNIIHKFEWGSTYIMTQKFKVINNMKPVLYMLTSSTAKSEFNFKSSEISINQD